MKRFSQVCFLSSLFLVGCTLGPSQEKRETLGSKALDMRQPADPFAGIRTYSPETEPQSPNELSTDRGIGKQDAAPSRHFSPVKPFLTEGTFVPSGWMGDAEQPSGPLKHELCSVGAYSFPSCDKWLYAPPSEYGELGWVAVAYQGPTANNWGSEKGMDLSGRRFTRLTFMARGERGGERLLVKSGGCTAPGAAYPASFKATIGLIVLDANWVQYEIPLVDCDLSNTCSILSFTISRGMAPNGCTFYLDDIVLRGPETQ